MRTTVAATAVCLSVVGLSQAGDADAVIRQDVRIPSEALGTALRTLEQDRSVEVIFLAEDVRDVYTHGAAGSLTTEEALSELLSGTGLTYRYLDQKTISIFPTSSSTTDNGSSAKEGKSNSSSGFRLAQVGEGATENLDAIATSNSARGGASASSVLEEVVVTAQKREERLQDVPVPVAAINADTLVQTNQLRLQDYYTQVPGLNVMAIGTQSTQVLSIRGINTGIAGNPSVGLTVDDVPYGASTNSGGGLLVPDFDPGDLAQVEVLRGPQGTLYGASSLGGLIKFVTRDPSFDELSGRVEAGTSSTYNGAKLGYNARASVNLPIGDTVAIRASGFTREDPGYIDNPLQRSDGLNKDSVYGGHLSALWKPSADFSLKLSALWQKMKSDGSSDVDVQAGLGDLQQDYLPGIGGYERRFQAYSATLSGNVGNIAVAAVTGYNINEYRDSWDASTIFGPVAQAAYNDPAISGSPDFDSNRTTKFTQELRLSGSIAGRVDWLLGGFYTHEASSYVADYIATNGVTGAAVGDGVRIDFPTTYAELAGFLNLTVRITDRFDVQLGGREGQIRQAFTQTETGPFVPLITGGLTPPVLTPETTAKADAFTYLVTPRFRLSPDLMVYVRLASGYRAGGVNGLVGGPNSSVPSQYDPDRTRNYEIGVKGDVLDHKLSFDASVYYIDWKDIQTSEYANGYGYIANASGAKSEGVEVSAEARPMKGLRIAGWVSWDEAVLTSAFPDTATVYGVSGSRLPYSARRSGNFSIDKDFPLGRRLTGFVGGMVSYVGDRQGEFTAGPPTPPPRQLYPAYAKTDLRAGVTYEAWRMSLFVNNLSDRRGVLAGGLGSFPAAAFTYIQPRTVGVSFARTF